MGTRLVMLDVPIGSWGKTSALAATPGKLALSSASGNDPREAEVLPWTSKSDLAARLTKSGKPFLRSHIILGVRHLMKTTQSG